MRHELLALQRDGVRDELSMHVQQQHEAVLNELRGPRSPPLVHAQRHPLPAGFGVSPHTCQRLDVSVRSALREQVHDHNWLQWRLAVHLGQFQQSVHVQLHHVLEQHDGLRQGPRLM